MAKKDKKKAKQEDYWDTEFQDDAATEQVQDNEETQPKSDPVVDDLADDFGGLMSTLKKHKGKKGKKQEAPMIDANEELQAMEAVVVEETPSKPSKDPGDGEENEFRVKTKKEKEKEKKEKEKAKKKAQVKHNLIFFLNFQAEKKKAGGAAPAAPVPEPEPEAEPEMAPEQVVTVPAGEPARDEDEVDEATEHAGAGYIFLNNALC